MSNGAKPKPKKRRDPLLEAADLLDAGRLTHEQIAAMTSPEAKAEAYQQDVSLPTMAAVGLGAAQGASFGLGDLAQKLTLNPTEQAALTATHAEHPYAWAAGRLGGAAVPFALTVGGATLPGLGARATQGLLGAAQGAGLTPGGPIERGVGAGAGGLLAAFAPELVAGAKTVGGKVPIIGPLARRLGGLQEGFPAPLKATAPPLVPSVAPAADVLATPTYARRAAAAAVPDARIPVNSYKELQQLLRSGVPKEQIKVNYWTRGGAAEQSVPPVPVAASQPVGPVLAFVRGQPYEALSSALANPNTPAQVRMVILQELRRRGIVGSGLLDPMNAPMQGAGGGLLNEAASPPATGLLAPSVSAPARATSLSDGFGIRESPFPNRAWEIHDLQGHTIRDFKTTADFQRWAAKNPFEPDPTRMGVLVPK